MKGNVTSGIMGRADLKVASEGQRNAGLAIRGVPQTLPGLQQRLLQHQHSALLQVYQIRQALDLALQIGKCIQLFA